ncbi:MAG: ATP cone domain-containing protein [Halioglobus sp.]
MPSGYLIKPNAGISSAQQTETNLKGTAAEAKTSRSQSAAGSGAIAATAPGHQAIKRNGTVVPFESSKISVAITKAFLAWRAARRRRPAAFMKPWPN